jgi:hypothetical protein
MRLIKIAIITTYYERLEELPKLLASIKRSLRNKKKYFVRHYIIDDGSHEEFALDKAPVSKYELKNYHINCYANYENLGKEGYWQTYNNVFNFAMQDKHDYVIFLPDDEIVCSNFFDRIFGLYETLPKGAMLQFLIDERIIKSLHGYPYENIDGTCLVPIEYMEALNWTVNKTEPPYPSSKVWRQITERILIKFPHAKVYTPDHSVVYHQCPRDSKMHTEQRSKHKITTFRWIDNNKPKKLGFINRWKGLLKKESKERSLLVVGGGLGNQVMSLPLYLQWQKHVKQLDVCINNCYVMQKDFYEIVTNYFDAKTYTQEEIEPGNYENQIVSSWGNGIKGIRVLDGAKRLLNNEVERNSEIGINNYFSSNNWNTHLFFCKEVLPIDWQEFRGLDLSSYVPSYDVIICNGSYNTFPWIKKRYMRWHEVVKILKSNGLTVASIGNPDEYIYGADDYIGISLLKSIDLVSQCKVFAGNCSGMTHVANALGKDTIYLLTLTSQEKNIDLEGFHCFSYPIQQIVCKNQPGQRAPAWALTAECSGCYDWKCAYEQDPVYIANTILKVYENEKKSRV